MRMEDCFTLLGARETEFRLGGFRSSLSGRQTKGEKRERGFGVEQLGGGVL